LVLTFTGTMSATEAGREEVRSMLVGALGCNLAWGLVDAVMYVITSIAMRGRGNVLLRELKASADKAAGHRMIADVLPERIAQTMEADDLERIRGRLVALPVPAARTRVLKEDLLAAVGVFLLVFLSTFPVTIPFMIVSNARRAIRISNAVALVMLFLLGWSLAKSTGGSPWRFGVAMLGLGMILVAIIIALGG
jgi:VIT1/CCC1 family predicted Fe2+/Mn2+ transporter